MLRGKMQETERTFLGLATLLWMACLIPGLRGYGERDVSLVFGSPIKEGDDLSMKCYINLPKNLTIYSVKWYKGQREIFRFLPEGNLKKSMPLGDLIIDERHSDIQQLNLKRVPAFMSGSISCEVTLELPYNVVIKKTAQLLVAVLPKESPTLRTSLGMFNHNLNVHQRLSANCTSPPSKPAVNLTFYINDFPVQPDEEWIGLTNHREAGPNDTEIQSGELELVLQKHHFSGGKFRLSCLGSMFKFYERRSEDFVGEQVKPQSKSQKQANSFFRNGGGRRAGEGAKMFELGLLFSLSITQFWRKLVLNLPTL